MKPLRKIIREFLNEYGVPKEELECGHIITQKQDHYGYTNAYRRRCSQCEKELKKRS